MVLSKIAKQLSKEDILIRDKEKFIDSLGIPGGNVASFIKLYDLRHCTVYALMREILTEWVKIKGDSATVRELRRILKEDDFNRIADQLQTLEETHSGPIKLLESTTEKESQPQPHSSRNPPPIQTKRFKPNPIIFGVKKVGLNFIGREDELKKLNEHFHSEECQIVCISGLGGIGKTELAKKFALSISDLVGTTQIAKSWLSGESPQALLNSCGKFCLHLGLSATDAEGKPLRMQEMLENIMVKLNSSRWLVIIDNVDEIHDEFQNAVKILCGFGSDVFILVTSRRRDIFPGELELLEVSELKLEASVQLVKKSLKIEDNSSENAIKSLCVQLGNYPLALGQAVAYIKQQQSTTLKGRAYGIQTYLKELAKTVTLGLDKDRKLAEYSTATLKVWNITLNKIRDVYGEEGETALDLLDVMAFINPDDIRMTSLIKLFNRFYAQYAEDSETEDSDENRDKDSDENRNKDSDENRNKDSDENRNKDSDENRNKDSDENMDKDSDADNDEADNRRIEFYLTLLLQYSLISSFDDVMSIHRLLQLALRDRMASIKKDVEMLNNFWTSFDGQEWYLAEMPNILLLWNHSKPHPDLDALRAGKIENVFMQLRDLGMVNESYDFASDGCEFLRNLYGSEHQEYFLMEQRLAMSLKEKGQHRESLEKLTFVHEKLQTLCGEEAIQTFTTTYNIAHVLYELERFEESLEWSQKTLQSSISLYGENHDATMKTRNQVALTLQHLGRGAESLELLNEIMAWEEVNFGKDDPDTVGTRHNIATCLYAEGMFAEALKNFQDVLIIHENLFGAEHPTTLSTKECVAETLYKMGEEAKALQIWEEALTTREKVMGPQHLDTIFARQRVADLSSKFKV